MQLESYELKSMAMTRINFLLVVLCILYFYTNASAQEISKPQAEVSNSFNSSETGTPSNLRGSKKTSEAHDTTTTTEERVADISNEVKRFFGKDSALGKIVEKMRRSPTTPKASAYLEKAHAYFKRLNDSTTPLERLHIYGTFLLFFIGAWALYTIE
ncbi:hypothetical protein PsorP6_004390 [Peronosclerospora sorghi]|uniref:Uncharacterized protein n=1 Tax=Peronosclerospora sorghi TaxID=230839 RepID=A0ACC0VNW8_9STRA|nr:hypothetical protein PsorP6_004390 [Peronosclerospora sorghi]